MSWRQGRKHGRLLKKVGVYLENEHSVRNLSKEIVANFIEVKRKIFLDEQNKEHNTPFGRIANLSKFVDYLLNSYETQNMLTWQMGHIPQDEIWIKIGGDHGKNSLKFTLQVANTDKPNAYRNTIVIGIASVRDTHANMVRFLEGGLGDDQTALQSHSWKGKAIKVFLNGDYEFLCKIYGLSGPQGTYPCLWCLMSRREMHNASDHSQPPSLESLLADNLAFRTETEGEKKEVAKHHNSLYAPLVGIALDRVSPPYLHILLGIVLRHHKFLEDAAHRLDKNIACQSETYLLPLGKTLKEYGSQWKEYLEFEERLRFEGGCLVFSETQEEIDKYTQQIQKTERLISFLTHKELKPRAGPIASSLDPVLNKHKITPQAYHSRSFVGNHCDKYLHPSVYRDLTNKKVTQTQACTYDPIIVDEAHLIQLHFNSLNTALSNVHKAISHTKPIQHSYLPDIQSSIDTYMSIYRKTFPQKVIPKQHLLERHCIPYIRQQTFGLGLLGEQGTELSHQAISKLEREQAFGIPNEIDRLKHILSAHLLQIAPALRCEDN